MGASVLVFLNKTDVDECMTADEVRTVTSSNPWCPLSGFVLITAGTAIRCYQDT